MSFDVVLGSVGSYVFASKVLDVAVSSSFALLLGLSVWCTYLADHLLDSYLKPNDSKYSFFRRNNKLFWGLLTLLSFGNATLLLIFLTREMLLYGLLLGIFLLIYLSFQHLLHSLYRKYFPKEFWISIVYTLAVWFFPMLAGNSFTSVSLLFMLVHFLVVLTNVLLFSYFERNEDISNSRSSSLMMLSSNNLKWIIATINLVGWLLSFVLLWHFSSSTVWTLIFVSAMYSAEILFIDNAGVRKYYGEITDGIFLIFFVPVLY